MVESPAELLPEVKDINGLKLIVTVRSDFEPHFEQSILKQYWKQGRFLIPLPGQKELIDNLVDAQLGIIIRSVRQHGNSTLYPRPAHAYNQTTQ